jgi:alpha-tubulin suppressor-like RCC1 family protein
MKKYILFFILFVLKNSTTIAQCWKSIDTKGDTNSYILAIRSDNTLWDFSTSAMGIQIGNQNIWEKCFSSFSSNFLIAQDSTLWGWGNNYYGELGIGNTNSQSTIIQLNNSKWLDVSSSWGSTTAIRQDGTLWFWGDLWPNTPILNPVQVGIDSDWIDVQASYSGVIALKSNGTLWAGENNSNLVQLGNDSDWNYIWAEEMEWWGIKNNGTLWYNGTQVGNDNNWKSIKGHMFAGTYGIKIDGTLWHWDNYNPPTPGSVITFNPLSSPTQINTVSNYQLISIRNDYLQGFNISCIHENDKLWLENFMIDASCPAVTEVNQLNNMNTIKVFPIPASTYITIDYGNLEMMNDYQLFIENPLGQQVFQTKLDHQSDCIYLNEWYVNGIYFIHIKDAQNNTVDKRKIILQ